jgi:hypothetical protein
MNIRSFAVAGILLLVALSSPALAVYHPGMGRFLQRDPHGMEVAATPRLAGAPATSRPFLARDFNPHQQYADGMNLYQVARSNPVRYVDPAGLAADEKPNSPCRLNGRVVTFTFDGIHFSGGGHTWPAYSGRPTVQSEEQNRRDGQYTTTALSFDYSRARQRLRDEGPIPEGKYWLNACCTNSAQNAWRHYWSYRQQSWGKYSWHIHPYPETDVADDTGQDRSGFFIHGSFRPGSAGCIDLVGNEVSFHDDVISKLRSGNPSEPCCYLDIFVTYATGSHTAVRKTYRPWVGVGGDSGWMPGSN